MVGERLARSGRLREEDIARLKGTAENAARVLGELRGLALKVGQTISYVDGILPPDATEVYQKALAKLQSAAPTVSFEEIRAEIERGLAKPLAEAFLTFDEAPVAAASIGQVHRATVKSEAGETVDVAVKVQYPGIARAVSSDLKNLEILRPVIAMLAPGADTKAGMDEVVARLSEELDYLRESRNQDRFSELMRGYPDVRIPRVFHAQTAVNVLTTEYIHGRSIRDIAQDPDDELRNRVGIAIFRFTLGTAFSRGVFNTDPHPGNYIVRDDGEVAFLDFGSVKFLPDALRAEWRQLARCLVSGNVTEWRTRAAKLLGMEHMDPRARQIHQDYMLQTAAVVAHNQEVLVDRHLIRQAADDGIASAKKLIREVGILPTRGKTMRMPADFLMIGRMQIGLFAVLAQLRARANWNRILDEMLEKTANAD